MATLVAHPLNSMEKPIRTFTKEMWETPAYYSHSNHWTIIAKGNIIEGIEAME